MGEGVRALHCPPSLPPRRRAAAARRAHAHSPLLRSLSQENRLLRDTPFLCEFQFRNELPLPPVGPKLLPLAVDRARLAAYQPFGFLWDRPQDCPFERDLGISLDPLESERFRAPPGGAPPLDPEDEALLASAGVTGGAAGDGGGGGSAFRTRRGPGGDTKSGWLMRTIYLSAQELPTFKAKDEDENARGRSVKERRLAEDGVLLRVPEGTDPRAAQVAAIEAQFEAVRAPPVHARNPLLRPVEVLPVLPDLERCHNAFVQAAFDTDPLVELLPPAAAAAQREALARRAFLKTYVVGREETGAPPEKVIIYFAPSGGASAPPPDEGLPVDFSWIREYNYKTVAEQEGQLPLLVFNLPSTLLHGSSPPSSQHPPAPAAAATAAAAAAPAAAEYVFVERRLDLRRRITRSTNGDQGDAPLPRPATTTLTNRKRRAEEEEAVAVARRAYTHPERERPATPMEEDEEAGGEPLALQDAATVAAEAVANVFGDDDDDAA